MKKIIQNVQYVIVGMVFCIAYGLMYLIPLRIASNIGAKIGKALSGLTRLPQRADKNLMRAMPTMSQEERHAVIDGMFVNLSRSMSEALQMFNQDIYSNDSHVEIVGKEHLEAVHASGKGAIFCIGHIGNWFYVPYAVKSMGLYTGLMYRRANNPYVDFFLEKILGKGATEMLAKGSDGGKRTLTLLKEGKCVVLAVDQKMNDGISVPFFGIEAMTAPAVARLGMKFDCPIIPVRSERISLDDVKCRLTFYPPLEVPEEGTTGDKTYALMLKINQLFESWIRERPEQWLWLHNRWPK